MISCANISNCCKFIQIGILFSQVAPASASLARVKHGGGALRTKTILHKQNARATGRIMTGAIIHPAGPGHQELIWQPPDPPAHLKKPRGPLPRLALLCAPLHTCPRAAHSGPGVHPTRVYPRTAAGQPGQNQPPSWRRRHTDGRRIRWTSLSKESPMRCPARALCPVPQTPSTPPS